MTATAAPSAGSERGSGGWQAVSGISDALLRGRSRPGGATYAGLRWVGAGAFVVVVVALVVTIVGQSSQAFAHSGVAFLWSGTWNPANNQYGAGILLVGTIVTTFVAMVIVVPVGLGVATFLAELAPRWIATPISTAVDLLAAAPSIVIGLWALLVLSPVFARHVEPTLRGLPILGHVFGGQAYGPSIILAAVVLAIMALPSVVTLSRTALQGVAVADREAAMAVGATRWQVTRIAVLPAARSGIAAALTLAVGRALGESIAVALVIGNRPAIPHSLLAPGATLGSAIVNQFAEATPGLGRSSVIALGAVLLLLTVLVNLGGQALLRRNRGSRGGNMVARGAPVLPRGPSVARPTAGSGPADAGPVDVGPVDSLPAAPAGAAGPNHQAGRADHGNLIRSRAARSLGRRRITGRAMEGLCGLAVIAGVAPLAALIVYTVGRGASVISLGFLTHNPVPEGIPGGGISPAITGSLKIAGLALLISVPVGLLTALFLFERKGRVASAIRFSAEVMTGIPTIIVGIFAYGLIVRPMHRFSDLAAGFAISVLMLPIMVRANEEAMATVPVDLWEAGIALGARRSSVARSVVVRGALPGILSGNLLAFSRGLGETAPLLFTAAAPTLALTLLIYNDGTQAFSDAQRTAWGAALVLLAAVLLLSVVTRFVAWVLDRQTR